MWLRSVHFNLKRHETVLSAKAIKIWINNCEKKGLGFKKEA